MASGNVPKPGRPLGVLTLIVLGLVATMFGTGTFVPKLGLDLSSGTSVTLTPKTRSGESPPEDHIVESVGIIRQRVNALGVSEAEVTKQGNNIVVSVPGQGQQEVVEQIGQTAKLRFRHVLLTQPAQPAPSPSQSSGGQASGQSSGNDQKDSGSDQQGSGGNEDSGGSGGGGDSNAPSARSPDNAAQDSSSAGNAPSRSRAASGVLLAGGQPGDQQGNSSQQGQQGQQGGSQSNPQQSLSPEQRQRLLQQLQQQRQQQGAQQQTSDIDKQVLRKFKNYDCSSDSNRALLPASQQVIACDRENAAKYVLSPVRIPGKMITEAQAGLPGRGQTGGWMVQLTFNGEGGKRFADLTGKLATQQPPRNQMAIVLDGEVVSAPSASKSITGGSATITGNFTQASASDLATILRFGSLPVTFEKSEIRSISPELGEDQLRAGLIAGGIGLVLVLLYSLLYYRGLGILMIISLVLAAAMSYATVVLLGLAVGYRLSLPGVAGLIVSVGITADSFVVYFERLRDEVREGRTLRTAVERGWQRARRTVITADVVQFLAAAVLWLLAVGGVKGFAFTLGITTLIDVLVVFLFTKPVLTLLARTRFFGEGRPLSGLDPRRLGARRTDPATARRSRTTPREA